MKVDIKILPVFVAFLIGMSGTVLADDSADVKQRGERGGHQAKMMEKLDSDGNGSISYDEFQAMTKERFEKMDLDGNGDVTPEEMKEARKAMKDKHGGKRIKGKKAEDAPDEITVSDPSED